MASNYRIRNRSCPDRGLGELPFSVFSVLAESAEFLVSILLVPREHLGYFSHGHDEALHGYCDSAILQSDGFEVIALCLVCISGVATAEQAFRRYFLPIQVSWQ